MLLSNPFSTAIVAYTSNQTHHDVGAYSGVHITIPFKASSFLLEGFWPASSQDIPSDPRVKVVLRFYGCTPQFVFAVKELKLTYDNAEAILLSILSLLWSLNMKFLSSNSMPG